MRRLADFVVRWPWVVIGLWVAIAVALPVTFPTLSEMAQKHPLAILPSDAPSSVTARKMTEAFHESGSEDLLLVVLTDDKGLGPADEAAYSKLVDALRQDTPRCLDVAGFRQHAAPALGPDQQGRQSLGAAGRRCGRVGHSTCLRRFQPHHRHRQTRRHRNAPDGKPHRTRSNRRRPHGRGRTRSSSDRGGDRASWCSSSCWWFTAARSLCCCRWSRSGCLW